MDSMLKKLEKYADNLENIVQQRTAELIDEKQKTDMLLYRMLPRCAFTVITRSPATAGTANRSLLFLEHIIPMPELFTELRFSILREFWTQEIRLLLLGGDAPGLG